jgi:hypothetical protein
LRSATARRIPEFAAHNAPVRHHRIAPAMTTPDFARMVPGFDFLQGLMKSAGSSLPGMGQWVAPTLDAEEVDKRIQELRTVQFWLEQNARMLAATIQALEVQRMTLATLQTMNVPMSELRESMKIDPATFAAAASAAPAAPAASPAPASAQPEPAAAATPPAVDPLQWWGALTRQFTDLATKAMQEMPTEAASVFAKTAAAAAAAAPAGKARATQAAAKAGKAAPAARKRAKGTRTAAPKAGT